VLSDDEHRVLRVLQGSRPPRSISAAMVSATRREENLEPVRGDSPD
jgi:hypothetical protein